MRQFVILILFICGFVFCSFGQMKGGIKAGANFSTIIVTKSGEALSDESYFTRPSFHAGSYFQQSFSDQLLWQIELLFSNKGYKKETSGETTNVSLNYLNWPILFIYRPIRLVEFEFGPELGYMITGEENFNSFDFGVDVGARFNISKKLNAGMRYSCGLPFKMKLDGTQPEEGDVTYQNSVLQFYLGFNLINEAADKNKQ
jgi:hypothetical protein